MELRDLKGRGMPRRAFVKSVDGIFRELLANTDKLAKERPDEIVSGLYVGDNRALPIASEGFSMSKRALCSFFGHDMTALQFKAMVDEKHWLYETVYKLVFSGVACNRATDEERKGKTFKTVNQHRLTLSDEVHNFIVRATED